MTDAAQEESTPSKSHVLRWFEGLEQTRGQRAELRRCHDLHEVGFCQGYYNLREALLRDGLVKDKDQGFPPYLDDQAALIAAALSHARAHQPAAGRYTTGDLAKRLAGSSPGEKPPMSELRFRRLITCDTPQEVFPLLIRAMSMIDGALDVNALARDLLRWSDAHDGQVMRRRWAEAYFTNLSA